MRIRFIFCLWVLTILRYSTAVNLECNFNMYSYVVVDSVYRCQVTTNLNIKSPEDAVIESVSGTHMSGKSNNDVINFDSESKVIEYFPKGLEKFFVNLKIIRILNGRLKQISLSDLKPFPNLIYLNVRDNDIEILEDDLFDDHPNMTVIVFTSNKIFHVGKNVFNNMNKIAHFEIGSNPCFNMNAYSATVIIGSPKTKCFDVLFANHTQNLANLENDSKTLTFYTFPIWSKNLVTLESEFQSSRFSYLISIKERFKALKELRIESVTQMSAKLISSTELPATNSLNSLIDDTTVQETLKFYNFEENLRLSVIEAMNQTEHNLKNSLDESFSLILDKFSSFDQKFLNSDENISNLSENLSNFHEKLSKDSNSKLDEKFSTILEKISNTDEKVSNLDEYFQNLTFITSNFDQNYSEFDKKVENFDQEMSKFDDKTSVFGEKISNFEENFSNFQEKFETFEEKFEILEEFKILTLQKLEKIETKLEFTRFKTLPTVDSKIDRLEKRLMGKIEELMEKKMEKFLNSLKN